MRSPLTYTVREYRSPTTSGITQPLRGTLDAIFKRDCDDSRCCVYNEHVATQLAHMLGLPIAHGALVSGRDALLYASLAVSEIGISLPSLTDRQLAKAAGRYPRELAGILVFDAWIGNPDRRDNLKVNLSPKTPIQLFVALDHSHSLLDARESVEASIEALRSGEVIVDRHPFAPHVNAELIDQWLQRIEALPIEAVLEVCVYDSPIGAATVNDQKRLADALEARRPHLRNIVQRLVA